MLASAAILCIVCVGMVICALDNVGAVGDGTTVNQEPSRQDTAGAGRRAVPGPVPNFESWPEPSPVDAGQFGRLAYDWAKKLEPNQAGVLWLALIVVLVVGFDFRRPLSSHNADLMALSLLGLLLIDVVELAEFKLDQPGNRWRFQTTFLGIFLVSAGLMVRSLAGALLRERPPWTPSLPHRPLVWLAVVLFAGNAVLALGRAPDDAGYYTNLGAKRFLETGYLPYGDPLLRGGAAATYGPFLYLAHVPFQLVLSTAIPNARVDQEGRNLQVGEAALRRYVPPLALATKLTLLMFHIAGVAALILIGRRLAGPSVGWALACLYLGSSYVQGLGGERLFITGMTFISHIAPTAVTLLAFAALERPFLAGSLLAGAAGVLFYPTFYLPAWFGYLFWRNKRSSGRFLAGFMVVLLLAVGFVWLRTQPSEGEGVLQAVYESTVGHQEAKGGYGASTFGFWGTHPRMAAFWQRPLISDWYLLKPAFMVFAVVVGASFFLARGRTVPQLALLTAAVAIAIQLWKSHAGGTYVEWYYPFLLIGLFARSMGKQECGTRTELGGDG